MRTMYHVQFMQLFLVFHSNSQKIVLQYIPINDTNLISFSKLFKRDISL